MSEPETIVDARGLACPHPVLQARAQLSTLKTGMRIALLATDPLASVDVRAYCQRAGHRLVSEQEVGEHLRFIIERGE